MILIMFFDYWAADLGSLKKYIYKVIFFIYFLQINIYLFYLGLQLIIIFIDD